MRPALPRVELSVGTGGSTFESKAAEAHPDRPWSFEGMKIVKPGDLTIPSSQLAVGRSRTPERSNRRAPTPRCSGGASFAASTSPHLAVLRCVDEGVDPNAPIEPIHEERNPFTGELVRRTSLHRMLDSFDAIVDGDIVSSAKLGAMVADGDSFDALVLRLPAAFVRRIAQLSEPAMNDLARRWERAWYGLAEPGRRSSQPFTEDLALRTLDVLVTAARVAIAANHDVFVWMPG